MKIVIPDALHEVFATAATAQGKDALALIVEALERAKDVPPGTRQLLVGPDALTELEALFGAGQILTADILVANVKTRGSVTFESLDLKLTTQQKRELETRAAKNGKPVAQLLDEIYQRLVADFFSSAGEGASGRPAAVPSVTVPDVALPTRAPGGRKLSHHERMAAHQAKRAVTQAARPKATQDARATEG